MSPELWAIVTTLGLGVATALALHFRNLAKRSDPDFQQKLEQGLLERLDEERAQRKIELADVKKHAEEERLQRKEELRENKIEATAALVAAKLEFKGERDGLLAKLAALELKFDALKADSETKYRTDTEALLQRVDAAEKRVEIAERRVEIAEKRVETLEKIVAGLTAENAGLRSASDKRPDTSPEGGAL